MSRSVRENLTAVVLIGLLAVGAAAITAYVLRQQGVRLPFVDPSPLVLEAELPSGQGVVPGQGQLITVAGARVGKVGAVGLRDGRARVQMQIDHEYRGLVRRDASVLLRPRTPLKDMMLELDPGTGKVAPEGFVVGVGNSLPDVNQDEILASLDADTRDYLTLLIQGGGTGLDARGPDLQEIYARFEPTHRDVAAVSGAVAARRRALSRLVSSLAELNGELARQPRQLTRLVDTSSVAFDAIAGQSRALRGSLRRLPPTLRTSRRALASTGTLARELRPTAARLRPTVRSLRAANRRLVPLARTATPLLRRQIRPFVRESRPLLADLRPGIGRAATATPELRRSFVVLNNLFNTLGYDPRAGKGPYDGSGTAGFLFWIAWASHNTATVFSTGDAHNIYRQVAVGMACDTIQETVDTFPQAEFLQNLTPVLTSPAGCGKRP